MDTLPALELLFSTSDRAESGRIATFLKQKAVRKIAPGIYTSRLTGDPGAIIFRNWYHILANQYPKALLSHRSALEFKPTPGGHIYLTHTFADVKELPGLTIHLVKGPPATGGDPRLFENLRVSEEARAFLENLQPSRKREETKTLTNVEIEERLEIIVRSRGENGLNQVRDRAKKLSAQLGMKKEFDKLNTIIGGLLSTGDTKKLSSPIALARALGEPVDPDRIRLFEILYNSLAGNTYPLPEDKNKSARSFETFAFFESYFSNYIEGTEFTVKEAKNIVETQIPMATRRDDSHDILGTYALVSNRQEMSLCPSSGEDFLHLLRRRHAVLLRSRTDKQPGEFKVRNNRAGTTEFVNWDLVTGTLKKGLEWYSLLREPFAKAVYMMFLVSEVHPFLDGNGRVARIMMNAELTSRGVSKIIIPTVYREDYLGALRKLTRQRQPESFINMMLRAFEFSAALNEKNIDILESKLKAKDAFLEPTEGKLKLI